MMPQLKENVENSVKIKKDLHSSRSVPPSQKFENHRCIPLNRDKVCYGLQISSKRRKRNISGGAAKDDGAKVEDRNRRQVDREDSDVEVKVVFEVLNPKNQTYIYTDVDLQPYTKYAYKIRTNNRAG